MGIGLGFLANLVELKRSGAIDGFTRVIEIGAQQLADSFLTADDLLSEVYSLFGKDRVQLGVPSGDGNFIKAAPSSRLFWQSLGFEYASIDFTGEHDSLALDLNRDAVPQNWIGRFDLVINTGTTEHIANQDNAFRMVHDLARKGAVMYHDVPLFMLGHGLINYSPRFFVHLFLRNGYDPLFIRMSRVESGKVPDYVTALNRKWGNDRAINLDGLDTMMITAAFRKAGRAPFATPLDIPKRALLPKYLRLPRTWRHLLALR
jgi:hypothetical protein